MTNFKLKKAILGDKLYFKEEDIVGGTANNLNSSLFTYDLGESLVSTMEYFEDTDVYAVPSGSWHKLEVEDIIDTRPKFTKNKLHFNGELREDQKLIADKILVGDKLYSGLIQAGCGFGKSFLGGFLLANYGEPTLILCHSVLLANQWFNLLKIFLPDVPIGMIGNNKDKVENITVGIYKSVGNRLDKLRDRFSLVIVDEAHKCPAATFSKVVNGLNVRVKIALTATPTRKDGMHVVLPDYFGPNKLIAKDTGKMIPAVQIIQTPVSFPIRNPKLEWSRGLTKLAKNDDYCNIIAEIAKEKISEGRALLILGDRLEMLELLKSKIPNSVLLVGETKNRDEILDNVGTTIDAVLSTNIFDEGISCHRLDTLLLTNPHNNSGRLEQRIGRIIRHHDDKKAPLVVDFWLQGAIVTAQQRKRHLWYIQKKYKILPTLTI